jgi:hypothetical protein
MSPQNAGEGAGIVGRLEARLEAEEQVDHPMGLVSAAAWVKLRADRLAERDDPDVIADPGGELAHGDGGVERMFETGHPLDLPGHRPARVEQQDQLLVAHGRSRAS